MTQVIEQTNQQPSVKKAGQPANPLADEKIAIEVEKLNLLWR